MGWIANRAPVSSRFPKVGGYIIIDPQGLINNSTNYRTALHLYVGNQALKKHLFNMKKIDTGVCLQGGYDEDTVVLCPTSLANVQCPATARLRGKVFRYHYLSFNDIICNYHITSIVS
mgnify:CR=1 FL=1